LTTPSDRTFISASAEESVEIGARLGRLLVGGEIVLFTGQLGAGKTTFIRGLAAGLGVDDAGAVHSPSYTLVNTYPGRIALTHIDAYFMQSAEDLLLCGFEEVADSGSVIAVEWADRLERFGGVEDFVSREPIRIVLTMESAGDEERRKIIIENWPGKTVA